MPHNHPTETSTSLTDAALVVSMQSGNEKAFAVLYDRYWEQLYEGAGKRLGSSAAAQDVVQPESGRQGACRAERAF